MYSDFTPARRDLPPYGPAKGMMEGLQLMTRLSPTRVDERLLRQHRVAPRNEYKVIGALRYLGLLDEDGRPSDTSRLLKTRGPAFNMNMQAIIKRAYSEIFDRFELQTVSRDELFNFFITDAGMGTEMAVKATRFFIDVCKLAEFEMNTGLEVKRGRKPGSRNKTTLAREVDDYSDDGADPRARRRRSAVAAPATATPAGGFMLNLTVSPELMLLDEERLTAFFVRLRRSLDRAFSEPGPANPTAI